MTLEMQLTKGYTCQIDNNDLELVSEMAWRAQVNKDGKVYAVHTVSTWRGGMNSAKQLYMHRIIMGAKLKELIDHTNGDTLDNRRENLRICDRSGNAANSKIRSDNSSGYRGVYKTKCGYTAYISKSGRTIYLGSFRDPILASKVYNRAAVELFGDFYRQSR